MKTVIVSRDPLDQSSYSSHEVDSIKAFLYEHFDGVRPDTLRIYNGQPSDENDVTPRCANDVARLDELDGPFYALVMPGDPGTAFLVTLAVVSSVAVGVGLALLSQPPTSTQRSNFQQPSPNNELGQRENRPRIGKRIEDIFGTVRSTPTLIAVPYSIYEDNIEKEIAYMCVGKGEYDISDVRDGDTLISDIDGASVEVYEPYTSPNGGYPIQTIGSAIGRDIITVERTAAVNGQVLQAPNVNQIVGDSDIKFTAPNQISTSNGNIDFSDLFSPGDAFIITNGGYTGASTYNFDGTYEVATAGVSSMTLVNPSAVNSDWSDLAAFEPGGATGFFSPTLTSGESVAIGPFTVGDSGSTGLFLNYVALNGLWKSDGENQTAITVNNKVTVSKAGESDEIFNQSMTGSVAKRETIGVTHYITPTFNGPYSVTIERTTDTDRAAGFTIQDEVKARDLYASSPVANTDFGDVTTILALTEATSGALAVKERRLNCLATRKIPKRNSNGTFTSNQTDYNARDVLIFTARDDYIGNRDDADIDFQGIADAIDECITYFGTEDGAEFNYTFDDDNLSFEETWRVISEAAFCEPYRQGNVLKLRFEGATSASRMLFNHRNTVPSSQARSTRFGPALNYDGVEYEYVDPSTDQVETITLPYGSTVINPRRIESIGIRNLNQAWWHANRAWNKIQYQSESVEVEALEQANALIRLDRVLCADNTRPDTSDGEVLGQSGLTLTLSQPHTFLSGFDYSIYLQYSDGSVQSIDILAGSTEYEVVLQSSPSGTIVTSDAKVQRTPYIIVGDNDQGIDAFLVDEIDPNGGDANTVNLRLINYDARYYQADGEEFSG